MLNKEQLTYKWKNSNPELFYLWFGDYVKMLDSDKKRTNKQSASLHLWFSMLEHEAENAGVTWDRLVKHTHQLRVTKENLKSACKDLIKSLWGYTSTTQIKKVGQIEIVVEHFAEWFGKEGIEVPPFPSDEQKEKEQLGGYKSSAGTQAAGLDYPEYIEPKI